MVRDKCFNTSFIEDLGRKFDLQKIYELSMSKELKITSDLLKENIQFEALSCLAFDKKRNSL